MQTIELSQQVQHDHCIKCTYFICQNLFFSLQLVQALHQLVHNKLLLLFCLLLLQSDENGSVNDIQAQLCDQASSVSLPDQ